MSQCEGELTDIPLRKIESQGNRAFKLSSEKKALEDGVVAKKLML